MYYFNEKHAVIYGLYESILIQNFIYWIKVNKAEGKNSHIAEDGIERTWSFNSVKAFNLLFPFWTPKQIRGALKNLIDSGVLITSNFNKRKNDKTLWYSFKDELKFIELKTAKEYKNEDSHYENVEKTDQKDFALQGNENNLLCPPGQMDVPSRANGFALRGKALPDSKPDIKPDSSRDRESQQQLGSPNLKDKEQVDNSIYRLFETYTGKQPHFTEVEKIRTHVMFDVNLSAEDCWEIIKQCFFDFNSWPRTKQSTQYLIGVIKGKKLDAVDEVEKKKKAAEGHRSAADRATEAKAADIERKEVIEQTWALFNEHKLKFTKEKRELFQNDLLNGKYMNVTNEIYKIIDDVA